MPSKEIKVKVLPQPNVPNVQGITFTKEQLDKCISDYMDNSNKMVMLQPNVQSGNPSADTDLDKVCGHVVDMTFNEQTNSYESIIKLIPNKNSKIVIECMDKVDFVLGTNKFGTIRKIKPTEINEYPEGTKLVPDDNVKIASLSLLDSAYTQSNSK